MLQYRDFPLKIMLIYVLFAIPFALAIFIISGLVSGTLFQGTLSPSEHYGLLGYGALAATITLPLFGLLIDRVRKHDLLMLLAAIVPSLVVLFNLETTTPGFSDVPGLLLATSTFASLALLLLTWIIRINQSVVVRFRARTVSTFLTIAIIFSIIFDILSNVGIIINSNIIALPAIISLIAVLVSIVFRPWKITKAALGIPGNAYQYFIPMAMIMASHLLWYLVTKQNLEAIIPSFVSLSDSVNFNPQFLEFVPLVAGILVSGIISDRMGRKTVFRFIVLLMGLLTIFGSSLYDANILNVLLVSERFVEGVMLGLCLFLIWPEIGSVKTKGIRVALYWFFFLGYIVLFWALDIKAEVFGITFNAPSWLNLIGGQVAILLSLIALFMTGPLPTTLTREIEMEDLDFGFDERQVKKTVDAYVGADDFASIRSQIDIMDASSDLSDSEVDDILGEEFRDMLPLRRIPGIGASLEKKLNAAGYESAAQLAGESAQRLAQKVEGLSVDRAEKILKDARKVVKKTVKKRK